MEESAMSNNANKRAREERARARASPTSNPTKKNKNQNAALPESPLVPLFCDLDGVLCDFDGGVKKICGGKAPDALPIGRMWAAVARTDRFFERLDWTSDGRELWEAIRHLNPSILTGVPSSKRPALSGAEKAKWCGREFQCQVNHVNMATKSRRHVVVSGKKKPGAINVISCWSSNKHLECTKGSILIDDRRKLEAAWEGAGGTFVHHVNTEATLHQLRKLGVLGVFSEPSNIDSEHDPVKVTATATATVSKCGDHNLEDYQPDTP
jgi:hypothetical protein